jgi:hypothetical protein
MRNVRATSRVAVLTAMILAAVFVSVSACAAAAPEISGQWIGNSSIDGQRSVSRATLSMAGIDSDGTTLRIEDANTCTLRKGKYSAAGEGSWTLSFGDASGGDGCKRLAAGTFALRRGERPKQLYLEATYQSADGAQAVRRAVFNRYP